jgi:hypothetical protein
MAGAALVCILDVGFVRRSDAPAGDALTVGEAKVLLAQIATTLSGESRADP